MKALKRPSAAVVDCFMKNDTVIGTIGNTHGVISMANPQRIASMMSVQSEPTLLLSSLETVSDEETSSVLDSMVTSSETAESSSGESCADDSFDAALCVAPATASGMENSQDSGAAQNRSLHPLQETSPVTVASFPVNLTLWVRVTKSKNTFSP